MVNQTMVCRSQVNSAKTNRVLLMLEDRSQRLVGCVSNWGHPKDGDLPVGFPLKNQAKKGTFKNKHKHTRTHTTG